MESFSKRDCEELIFAIFTASSLSLMKCHILLFMYIMSNISESRMTYLCKFMCHKKHKFRGQSFLRIINKS